MSKFWNNTTDRIFLRRYFKLRFVAKTDENFNFLQKYILYLIYIYIL